MPATAPPVSAGDGQGEPGCETTIVADVDPTAPAPTPAPLGRLEIALVFGLPLFLAMAGVLTWWSVRHIEQHVEADLVADLTAARVDPEAVAIEVRYRDASVQGTVASGTDRHAIDEATAGGLLRELDTSGLQWAEAEADRGVGAEVDDREVATGPVRIDVAYDGMNLRVGGTVLNEGQHNVVLETLDTLAGRADIDGELAISRLAPAVAGADARVADLVTALESMDLAEEWRVRLTDRELTIEATVVDPEAAAAVGALDALLTSTPTTVEVRNPNDVEET